MNLYGVLSFGCVKKSDFAEPFCLSFLYTTIFHLASSSYFMNLSMGFYELGVCKTQILMNPFGPFYFIYLCV
uniref:Putative ovule protein n=1 Tax=Solanum chacoense TaxID=4108 RepID=A0A0V0H2V6_SOLCH